MNVAEKDVYQSEFTPARRHEGWEYVVECLTGPRLYFRDRDPLAALLERWTAALLKGSMTLVTFTGCRGIPEVEVKGEDGKVSYRPDYVDGGGAVLAPQVVSIRYAGGLVARDALDDKHAENLADAADGVDDEDDFEDEDDGEPAPKVSAAGAGQRKWTPPAQGGAAVTGDQEQPA